MLLSVAIDAPLRRTFDYRCPSAVDIERVAPGTRVWVPFGRRRVVGVVLALREHSDLPLEKLKTIHEVIDCEPAIEASLLNLLRWSADYYRHPIGEVVSTALPTLLRAGEPLRQEQLVWRLTALGRAEALTAIPARAGRQRALIERLFEKDSSSTKELLDAAGGTLAPLRSLASKGYIERAAAPREPAAPSAMSGEGPALNEAQRAAVDRVLASVGQFASHLLYGVTGSGKTEVYLRLIAEVIAQGRQALVLVPEIALTPQLLHRFRARFAAPIAVMHSALNDTERLHAWRAAREGSARIILGTRSAIFAPLRAAGLIVVDEEHDPSFKQQEGFRYSARDLAIVRAQRLNVPIVLGSATPSLETLHRAQRQPEWVSRLPERAAANARPPRWTLIDLRRNAQTQGIATPTLLAMRKHLDSGGQIMLFLNRRGYAPVLFCPSCGWSARCKRCDAHLTVHGRAGALLCHHCGAQHSRIEHCPSCSSPVKPVGQGTERVEEAVDAMFQNVPIARLDRDSMRRKGDLESLLARIDRGEIRIVVGTQMLAKGHDFPNVTLVVVLNADQGLFSTDFRASERLAQTIVQVAGRAGRAEKPGEVLIQTEYPDHPLLKLLLQGGYEAFAAGAMAEREQCKWPPFGRIALLRAEAALPGPPLRFLEAARNIAQQSVRDVRILGPVPAPMERRAGRHRAQLLVHANSHAPLQRFMQGWLPQIEALAEAKQVRWSIDVDAAELF